MLRLAEKVDAYLDGVCAALGSIQEAANRESVAGFPGGCGHRRSTSGWCGAGPPPSPPAPLLPHGFEHGLDLPEDGIPEAATEHGLRGSLIWAEGPWGHIDMDRHVVNMQHLRRN